MSEQVCSNFQIDLTGAFGICKNCKLPKIQHNISREPAKSINSNFADKKHIFEKDFQKQNEKEKINDFPKNPQKINIKQNDEQKEICKNFQVDLTGEFGKCKNCKQSKINHENPVNNSINNNFSNKNVEKKPQEEKLLVNAVPPRRATQIKPEEEKPHPFNDRKAPQTKPEKEKPQHPCNDFKLSLAGEYGICANCKFTKHQHSDDAIFKKHRDKGNSITNKPSEETKANEIKVLPKEEKKIENFKAAEKEINYLEKKEIPKNQNPKENPKTNEKVEESVPCKNFKIDLVGEFGKCQNCKFNKTQHSPEAVVPKPLETRKSFNIVKNDEKIVASQPKLPEKKEVPSQMKTHEEVNLSKIDEKDSSNNRSAGQNLQKRDSFNINLKKTFEHDKTNQLASNLQDTEFVNCGKFEIDMLGEFGMCKNCKNLKSKHNPEALQQNKKPSVVMKTPPTFLNSNDKEKPKENVAAVEITKAKKDSVKDKAMILQGLGAGPFGKGPKEDVEGNSNEGHEGEIPSSSSKESNDKYEILKDSDAKTTMPQKKPKSSAAFVPDLRKSNISFEKKIAPIIVNPTIEKLEAPSNRFNASEKKNETHLSSDIIEEETLKKKKPYTIRAKPLQEEHDEDLVAPIPPASLPTPPPPPTRTQFSNNFNAPPPPPTRSQLSNNFNEEETLKRKLVASSKKSLFDDDDEEELDTRGKNNNAKPTVQIKKKALFDDSEDSEQSSSEEDSDEEDKKKKMEMKAKFNKALSNRYE